MIFNQEGQQVGVQFNFRDEEAQEAFVEEASLVTTRVVFGYFLDVGERLARETSDENSPVVLEAIGMACVRAGDETDVGRCLDRMLQGFLGEKLVGGLRVSAQ